MAHKTDMAKARAKYEEEKERAARQANFGRRADWWKPKAGTNKIRILPPWTDEGPNRNQWWRELWMHYGVTNLEAPDEDNTFAVPCPKKSPDGKEIVGDGAKPECKVCDLVSELRGTGNPADAETAKQIQAKMRVYINMIDKNDPMWTQDDVTTKKNNGVPEDQLPEVGTPKVQVYNFGPQVFKGMLDAYSDDVDLADLDEGHDVVIEREGEGLKTKYRVRAQFKATPAPITDEQLDDNIWDMDQLVPYFNAEQIDMILEGGTREDVFALSAPQETKQLKEKTREEEPTEEEAAPTEEEEATEEKVETAPADSSVLDSDSIPVDEDGDILFDELTDEQIENPANAEAKVTNRDGEEYGVHVSCFGDKNEHNAEDDTCAECFLLHRCGARIDSKEAARKAAEAAKKKKPGRPKKATPAKKPGRPKKVTAGKGNGAKAKAKEEEEAPAPAANADDLEAQMMAALGKK